MARSGRNLHDIKAALDFGCGYGRVLRFLAQYVGPSTITACDIDAPAVAFCAKEFEARPLHSGLDLTLVQFEEYDLIWLGSVLTHVSAATGARLVSVLASHLSKPGLLAFSTHGTHSIEHLELFGERITASEGEIRADLAAGGVAFVPYFHYGGDGYGLTWHDPQLVPRLPAIVTARLELVLCRLDHWGAGKQDLWAFRTQ
jgi:SAM-dependent methyltransferase